MGLTGWGDLNYLRRLSQVIDAYPFVLSGWAMRPAAGAQDATILSVGTAGSEVHRGEIRLHSSFVVNGTTYNGTTFEGATASGTASASVWFHAYGEFLGIASRAASLNGTGRGTAATSITAAASNSVHVGRRLNSWWYATGGLAEMSLWNGTGMTDPNRASLGTKLSGGQNPLNINIEAGQP